MLRLAQYPGVTEASRGGTVEDGQNTTRSRRGFAA
ncbi:stress-induced protein, partial [Xanthomonas euvesicatoria]